MVSQFLIQLRLEASVLEIFLFVWYMLDGMPVRAAICFVLLEIKESVDMPFLCVGGNSLHSALARYMNQLLLSFFSCIAPQISMEDVSLQRHLQPPQPELISSIETPPPP